ncbi:hypothetical protein ES288_A02G122900v1 [Gossypium darwinii]|uniref:PAP-associated domain-containing protein n=1 Tax=Gossypium darwinii TaxID=34276 RepID=A0A5D2HDH9_GOSDA|nr:hypothetical protein ES288_A02G122900v1 [Gossypium darwinii]
MFTLQFFFIHEIFHLKLCGFVLLREDVRKRKLKLGSLRNSKGEKDWTRRIGNDRHLICIEDPFVVSHDLGRVVDKFSIKILREEFERVTNVMQYDPNPWITLFEPYVPG